jgi:hypothetical protein
MGWLEGALFAGEGEDGEGMSKSKSLPEPDTPRRSYWASMYSRSLLRSSADGGGVPGCGFWPNTRSGLTVSGCPKWKGSVDSDCVDGDGVACGVLAGTGTITGIITG